MNHPFKYVIVAVHGTIASTVFAPLEILQVCKLMAQAMPHLSSEAIEFEVLSPEGNTFVSSSGYELPTDGGLRDLPQGTVIFFPGFGLVQEDVLVDKLQTYRGLGEWLQQQFQRGCYIASGCSGNFLLADCGLLRNQRATTNWMFADLFRKRYPQLELDLDAILIEHDRIFSVGGILCGLDLTLALVEKFVEPELARLCTKLMVLGNRRPGDVNYEQQQPSLHDDRMVDTAIEWIRENLHQRFSVGDVIKTLPTSKRNFSRRFKQATGETPQGFIQRMRINRAKTLLQSSEITIDQIIEKVGYADNSAFSRSFRNHTQLTPKQYRQQFKQNV